MGRKSKTIGDYESLAEEKGLTFVGQVSPRYTTEKTLWRCNRCGRESLRSYWSVQRTNCLCHTRTLQESDYHTLAESLGLKWIGPRLPQNIQEKTTWADNDAGMFFKASYDRLNRRKVPAKERYAHA